MNISAINYGNVNFKSNNIKKNVEHNNKHVTVTEEKPEYKEYIFYPPINAYQPHSRFEYRSDIIEDVKENSRNNENKFDLHFAKLLCTALKRYPKSNPPVDIIAKELKAATAKEPEKEMDIVTGFNRTIELCPIGQDNGEFQELFPLSYNSVTGKYDDKSNKILCELLSRTEQSHERKELIKEYFETIKDKETGELKKYFEPTMYSYFKQQ